MDTIIHTTWTKVGFFGSSVKNRLKNREIVGKNHFSTPTPIGTAADFLRVREGKKF